MIRALGFAAAAAILLSNHPLSVDRVDTSTEGSAPSTSAGASDSSGAQVPQLKIDLVGDHASAAAGDKINYILTVQNFGTDPVEDLELSQTLGPGTTFESADADGVLREGSVHWTTDLVPAAIKEFHTVLSVDSTPTDLLRLASVACATMAGEASPLICASQSAQLPAGAAAEASAQAGSREASTRWIVYTGAAVVVLVLAAAVFLLRRRFGRRRTGDASGSRHLRRE